MQECAEEFGIDDAKAKQMIMHKYRNTCLYEIYNLSMRGCKLNVKEKSVTSSSAIDKALSAAASGEPGAADLPDLFTAYPRVVEIIGKEKLLAWNDYFTDEELSAFHDVFLSEGYFDDKLLILSSSIKSFT